MRTAFAVLLTASALVVPAAAVAGPPIPTNCHELNELLHIDNVRNCDE